jgi:ML domain
MTRGGVLAALAAVLVCLVAPGAAVVPHGPRWRFRQSLPYKTCSSAAHVHNLTINADPYPAQPGKNISISLEGVLDEEVTAGAVKVVVSLMGVPILTENLNLCTDLRPEVTCPIEEGPWALNTTQTVPSNIPSGTYTVLTNVTDQNNQVLSCTSMALQVA